MRSFMNGRSFILSQVRLNSDTIRILSVKRLLITFVPPKDLVVNRVGNTFFCEKVIMIFSVGKGKHCAT